MTIHGLYLNILKRNPLIPCRQDLDPLTSVVPNRHSFGQIEYPISTVLRFVPLVSLDVPRVLLQPEVANVQQAAWSKDPTDFLDDRLLAHTGWNTRQDANQKHRVYGTGWNPAAQERRVL